MHGGEFLKEIYNKQWRKFKKFKIICVNNSLKECENDRV